MLKKTRAAGLIVATAAGTMLMGSPAFADTGWNNNAQAVPVQLCNSDITGVGANVAIASPETVGGPCINGAVQD